MCGTKCKKKCHLKTLEEKALCGARNGDEKAMVEADELKKVTCANCKFAIESLPFNEKE